MKIEAERAGGSAHLQLHGRLDREWAEHLSQTLEELLRDGVRAVTLDLAGVTYVSSAATMVLSRWRRELAVLRGEVRLTAVPPPVRDGFAVAGWSEDADAGPGGIGMVDLRQSSWHSRADLAASGQYELSACAPAGTLRCRLHGQPGFPPALATPAHIEPLALTPDTFALGIGAIGSSYSEARDRLGELLAVAGAAAYFPSDGARLADWLVGGGGAPPQAVLASGLSCRGEFSQLIRFNAKPEARAVPLSELATVALDAAGGRIAGLVVAAETAGLAGARLLHSPAAATAASFELPAVRDWLSFAPEPIHARATALLAGVVARSPEGPLAAQLRPLGESRGLVGHFHAAVFSYHPLPQRTVELGALARTLFTTQELRDVLHLLWDPRGARGVGESTLVRGVGWVGPITT